MIPCNVLQEIQLLFAIIYNTLIQLSNLNVRWPTVV